jgi:hypothetical protein
VLTAPLSCTPSYYSSCIDGTWIISNILFRPRHPPLPKQSSKKIPMSSPTYSELFWQRSELQVQETESHRCDICSSITYDKFRAEDPAAEYFRPKAVIIGSYAYISKHSLGAGSAVSCCDRSHRARRSSAGRWLSMMSQLLDSNYL